MSGAPDDPLAPLAGAPPLVLVDGRHARRLTPEGAGREAILRAALGEVDGAVMAVRCVLAAAPDGPRVELTMGCRRLRGPGDALERLDAFARAAAGRAVAVLTEGAPGAAGGGGGLTAAAMAQRLGLEEAEPDGAARLVAALRPLARALSRQSAEGEIEAVIGDGGASDARARALGARGAAMEAARLEAGSDDAPWIVCWSGGEGPEGGAAALAVWPAGQARVLAAFDAAHLPRVLAAFAALGGGSD